MPNYALDNADIVREGIMHYLSTIPQGNGKDEWELRFIKPLRSSCCAVR
jgi:hypothetical protein